MKQELIRINPKLHKFYRSYREAEDDQITPYEYKNLPIGYIGFDSLGDTLLHIKRVNELLLKASEELMRRAAVHDSSKLSGNERLAFNKNTPKLKHLEYGTIDYNDALVALGSALNEHYSKNSHHPEYYKERINGMNLFDIMEMMLDWKAASERHETGNIRTSINKNKKRFKLGKKLTRILMNTVDYLEKNYPLFRENRWQKYAPSNELENLKDDK